MLFGFFNRGKHITSTRLQQTNSSFQKDASGAETRGVRTQSSDEAPLIAAYAGSMDFIVSFVNAGAVSFADAGGNTLLHAAAEGWQYRMIEYLIISGADPNAQNHNGDTPLHAVSRCSEPPPDGTFLDGTDPAKARSETFQTLLLRCADPSIKNKQGATPLHLAAWQGDLFAVLQLAPHSMIDDVTTKGATALVLAVLNDHISCAKALLNFGASVDIVLSSGKRLSDLIRSSENSEMRTLLE